MIKYLRLVVMSAAAASLASMALAQQGNVPSGTTLPKPTQGPANPPKVNPNATKPVTTRPATGLVPAGSIQSWEQAQAGARDRPAMMTCQGPLTLEIRANDPRDASKGVNYLLSFNESASAATVKPGECWRQGGFQFGDGNLNRGLKKSDIFYEPPVTKCPAIKTMKIEKGKVTGSFNEVVYSEQMFKAASGPGQFAFETKWLNFNGPSGQANGWGHYIGVSGDAVTPAVPGCRG